MNDRICRGILLLFLIALVSLSSTPAIAADEIVEPAVEKSATFEDKLNGFFGELNSVVGEVLYYDLAFGAIERIDEKGNAETVKLRFIVVFLAVGSVFFTFWFGWINLRGFKHSINIIRGKFDNPDDHGEITHFRALTSALSATIGLGNIAGVAIAVKTGGPGAVLWMMILAVFGMTAKFSECTLAQMYRKTNPDGSISGGPMYYLDLGLREKGKIWGVLGKTLAILFAILVMVAALGGGNMFQANQSFEAFQVAFELDANNPWLARGFGIIMAGLVAVVILGGITRIGAATCRIVPAMCAVYVLAALVIITAHYDQLPHAIATIFNEAFNPSAMRGGILGVIIIGFTRAAFSNEAGVGSAAIAHSAAKTDEPAREGLVAMIGPFIDTICICAMTGLVVVITGAYELNAVEGVKNEGVGVTMTAFQSVDFLAGWFPYVLSLSIVLFAFSTMISWCYYGERGWGYLFGTKTVNIYRLIFVVFVYFGSVMSLGNVIDFSDMMILSMAFPSILGGVILAPKVKRKLNDYWTRYQSGEMKTVEKR